MESSKTEENIHKVRIIETDQAAVSATIRKLELFISIVFAISIVIIIFAFCIYIPQSNNPMFHELLTVFFLLGVIVLGFIHFVAPFCLRKTDVHIGSDFIAGPGDSFYMRMTGHKVVLDYDEIIGVNLDVSKDRIIGATVIGKGFAMMLVRRIKEPKTVIRAIREHTGSEVQWRSSPPRFKKLTGDEVDSLINKKEKNLYEQP